MNESMGSDHLSIEVKLSEARKKVISFKNVREVKWDEFKTFFEMKLCVTLYLK